MTSREFCAPQSNEHLKAAWHGAMCLLAFGACAYNAVAWSYRRERHLAANALLYAGMTALETRKIAHHLQSR